MTVRVPLPQERERERAVLLIILLDFVALGGVLAFGLLSRSLTLVADGVRGELLLLVEVYSLWTLRRIHRGLFAEYEYGTGKIERLVNVAISLSLYAAAAGVAWTALAGDHPPPPSSALYLAIGLFFAEGNLLINLYGLVRFARANEEQPSLILTAQLEARLIKTVSSFVVFLAVIASDVVPDPTVGRAVDVLGSLFVCVVMARTATRLLRESMPDLLDLSLGEEVQNVVYRALVNSFERYDDVVGVRTRRSGRQLFVEVRLAFDGGTTMAQVMSAEREIEDQIRDELPESSISIVPVASAPQRHRLAS